MREALATLAEDAGALGDGPAARAVIAGDFNSAPDSAVYDFVSKGHLDCSRVDRERVGGMVQSWGVSRGPLAQLRYYRYGHRGAGLAAGVYEPCEATVPADDPGRSAALRPKKPWKLNRMMGGRQYDVAAAPGPAVDNGRTVEVDAGVGISVALASDDGTSARASPSKEPADRQAIESDLGCDDLFIPMPDEEWPPEPTNGAMADDRAAAGAAGGEVAGATGAAVAGGDEAGGRPGLPLGLAETHADADVAEGGDGTAPGLPLGLSPMLFPREDTEEISAEGNAEQVSSEDVSEAVGGATGDDSESEGEGSDAVDSNALKQRLGDPSASTVAWQAFAGRHWDAESLAMATGRPAGGEAELALPVEERAMAKHAFGSALASAYAQVPGSNVKHVGPTTGEPAATTLHNKYVGTVDYIWLSSGSLHCSGVLEPPHADALETARCLPSAAAPWSGAAGSDHIPLLAELELL